VFGVTFVGSQFSYILSEQVGYPNVGKSSTINTILRNKKVSVSVTPGHTKHFQVKTGSDVTCWTSYNVFL
jgi:GTPase Era involved in 16S rRNA processing